MASIAPLGQWAPGVDWEEVPASPPTPVESFQQRMAYRVGQWAMTRQVRAAMAAHRRGPEAFGKFIARGRAWHDRYDRPILRMVDAEAVRVGAPPTAVPPPLPSDWFA